MNRPLKKLATGFLAVGVLAFAAGQAEAGWNFHGSHGSHGSSGSYGSKGSYGSSGSHGSHGSYVTKVYISKGSHGSSGSKGSYGSHGSHGSSGSRGGLLSRLFNHRHKIHSHYSYGSWGGYSSKGSHGSYGSSGSSGSYGSRGSYGSHGSYGSKGSYGSHGSSGGTIYKVMPAKPAEEAKPADGDNADPLPDPGKDASVRGNDGLLTVSVPADAKVTINGYETKSTGNRRSYVSRELTPGKGYNYEVRVTATVNGKEVEQLKKTTLRAGQIANLDFDFQTTQTTLTVNVPDDAVVYLGGVKTSAKGAQRIFKTTDLAIGQKWSDYKIVVKIDRDGKEEKVEKTITLAAGDSKELTFDFPARVAATR